MGIAKLLASLLVPAYVVLIAVLDTFNIRGAFEPPLLILVLNTLFLGIVLVAVAYIAARVYFTTGSSSIFLTGCGMLTFGLCTIPAGWLIGMPGGPNTAVTMHNTGALVGAFFLALESILNLVGRKCHRVSGEQASRRWLRLIDPCVYSRHYPDDFGRPRGYLEKLRTSSQLLLSRPVDMEQFTKALECLGEFWFNMVRLLRK